MWRNNVDTDITWYWYCQADWLLLYFKESSLQLSSLYSQVQSVAYYEYLFSVKLQDCLFDFVIPVHHTLHMALIWRREFQYFSKVMPSWLIWVTGIFLMLMREQHRRDKRQEMEKKWWDISYVAHPVEVHAAHLTLAFTLVLMICSFKNLLQAVASGGY